MKNKDRLMHISPRTLTTADIARRRLVWAKHLQRKNEKLEAEAKRLREYNNALLNWMMNHLDRDEDEVKEMIYE